ncbi:response regulator transcription factor [Arthrobacter sp. H5]|uniref:response regulator transcription factor n=1 Tax=Arthrobacter sp. H5 TaxID=1267973 RepID=UPI000482253C|nr:response regulator transcription factor [Arthrobacter sp. H5]
MSTDSVVRTAVVVEDDADIRGLLTLTLSMNGFTIFEAANGKDGLDLIREHQPDLITLDLNLPDIDGMEVCRQIRPHTDAYIIMVTARAEEIDQVIGLEIGADDFITKPFSPREVRARISAMFRRPRRSAEDQPAAPATVSEEADADVVVHGSLAVDIEGRVASLHGEELPLTRIEFDLLATLISGPRRVWTRETLLAKIWGEGWTNDQHLVEVHIRNLRKKLGEDTREPRFIKTVRGVGYRLVPVS